MFYAVCVGAGLAVVGGGVGWCRRWSWCWVAVVSAVRVEVWALVSACDLVRRVQLAGDHRPKVGVAGGCVYRWVMGCNRFREIAAKVVVVLMVALAPDRGVAPGNG